MYETFTKSMLQNGDFIKRRNGGFGFVLKDLGAIVYKNGRYSDLDSFDEQLNNLHVLNDGDIVKVFRPKFASDCSFLKAAREPEELLVFNRDTNFLRDDVCVANIPEDTDIPDDAISDPASAFGF